VRVAIADDTPLWTHGISRLLVEAGIEVTAIAHDGDELVRLVEADPPDAVIIDIEMPPGGDGGIVAARRLRAMYPTLGILALSQYDYVHYATRLLECGAHGTGYRLKDAVADVDALRETLRRLVEGEAVIEPQIVRQLAAQHTVSHEGSALDQLTPIEHGYRRAARHHGQVRGEACRSHLHEARPASRRKTPRSARAGSAHVLEGLSLRPAEHHGQSRSNRCIRR
jgi:DNA-binding NarL/FixJ family response regulator